MSFIRGGSGGGTGSLIRYGTVDLGNIGSGAGAVAVSGDFSSATKSDDGASSHYDVVFKTPLINTDYDLTISLTIISGTVNDNNDINHPITTNKSTTGFSFNIDADTAHSENLRAHVRIESNANTQLTPPATNLLKYGEIAYGDIAGTPVGALTVIGDFASATKTQIGTNDDQLDVVFDSPLLDTNYNVICEWISNSNHVTGNDARPPAVITKLTTGFSLTIGEGSPSIQDLDLNIRVVSNVNTVQNQLVVDRLLLYSVIELGDIGAGSSGLITHTGDFTTVSKSNAAGISTLTITFPDLSHTDYNVLGEFITLGNQVNDSLISGFVVNNKTSTGCELVIREAAGVVQDLEFNVSIVRNN